MTIASTLTTKQYTSTGVNVQFAFPNKIFSASDLVVTIFDLLGNAYPFVNFASAALGLTFSVQGVDVDTGCTVVLSGPFTLNWTIDIRTQTADTQSTSIKNQGSFLPELHEEAFDRATRQIQDLLRLTYTFGIHGPDTETAPWAALPGPSVRKGQALMFDAVSGLPVLGTPVTQVITTGLLAPFLGLSQTALESAAGITPTNLAYPPGDVRRYGADPTGVADSTYAFQQACFSAYGSWVPTSTPYKVTVPQGRYKFAGVNTPYGTPTVFVRAGMAMLGSGMGTFMDCSLWGAVATNVFQAGWGFISGVATQDAGGQPPEMAEMFFLGGPSGGGATISHKFPGGIYHHLWFSGPGLGMYMGGCWMDSCEFDIGLQGIVVGGGNQTITNCRFFNQNFNITFDAAIESSDVIINGCCFEYTQFAAIQALSGAGAVKGIKVVGCDFFMNAQYSTFSSYITVTQPNAQIEIDSCSFHNWGQTPAVSSVYALTVNAAGAVVDVKDCVFDGVKTNSTYAQSTTAAGILLQSGTLRIADCQFRNLPATYGFGITYSGSAVCSLQVNGLLYSSIGVAQLINISNNNAASACYLSGIKGDAVTPLVNAQGTVLVQFKNLTDWFGPITTSGGSHVVLGVPYQFSNVYQITVRANANAAGNASYRKCTMTFAEKDNDFATSAKSFIATTTPIQGAANLNGVIATVVEFGAVGGTQTIALSNSGNLAISWPNTYSLESVDVQVIM